MSSAEWTVPVKVVWLVAPLQRENDDGAWRLHSGGGRSSDDDVLGRIPFSLHSRERESSRSHGLVAREARKKTTVVQQQYRDHHEPSATDDDDDKDVGYFRCVDRVYPWGSLRTGALWRELFGSPEGT